MSWYQAGTSVGKTLGKDTDNTISSAVKEYSAGGFTVTPSVTLTGTPALTDQDGKTYYYAGAVTGAEIPDEEYADADKYVELTVSITIEYDGESTTPADIKALWNSIDKSSQVTVTITDITGLTNGAGLKFFDEAPVTDSDSSTHEFAGSGSATITFDTSDLTFNAAGECTAGIGTAVGHVYVGIKGVNALAQSSSDSYTVQAATSLTGE